MHNYLRCVMDAHLNSVAEASDIGGQKIVEVRENDKGGVSK
jgi:hypothetical protein